MGSAVQPSNRDVNYGHHQNGCECFHRDFFYASRRSLLKLERADIRVERGEFNCVEDAVDENHGTELLNSVFRAIYGD
jgi:hypothetical protein